jgi:hypothetical protein
MKHSMKQLLLVTAAALSISTGALADETLKFRGVYQATSLQSMDVGDVDGHSMTIAHITGLVLMPDGSIAQSYFTAFLNYTNGNGPFTTYNNVTFSDGSTLWFKVDGVAVADPKKADFKGGIAVIGGTGRYAGAKGDGSLVGTRYVSLPTQGAQLYNDVVINLKK